MLCGIVSPWCLQAFKPDTGLVLAFMSLALHTKQLETINQAA
jgi:hypothetical protein